MNNLMTDVSNKAFDYLKLFDKKVKRYAGEMPYGKVKVTPKEDRERFNNLTPGELQNLIQTHGRAGVNEWLRGHMNGQQI